MLAKPCRLEINNSGSWKTLGHFDAANELHAQTIMNSAEELVKLLNQGNTIKRWPTLRISMDDGLASVLMHWTVERGWYESQRASA